MIVFDARVPMSGWTLVGLVVGTAASLFCWRAIARKLEWRPAPTLVALLSLTAILAITGAPDGALPPIRLSDCVPLDLSKLAYKALHTGGGLTADVLNGILPMPFTAALTLASGRGRLVLVIAVLLPGLIELTQTLLPGRQCAISDYLTNTLGGIAGVGLGWVLRRRLPQP